MKDIKTILIYILIYSFSGAFIFFLNFLLSEKLGIVNDFYTTKYTETSIFFILSFLFMRRNFISIINEFRLDDFFRPMVFSLLPIFLFVGIGVLFVLIFHVQTKTEGATNDISSHLGNIFLISILAPFYEEILFRGILLNFLRNNIKQESSLVVCSVIFAAAHISGFADQQNIVFPIMFLFFTGCYYCYLKIKFNSLAPGFFTHATFNFIYALVN